MYFKTNYTILIFILLSTSSNIQYLKLQNSYNAGELVDMGSFPPISPHVNVPNTHAFNHNHVPPPLPPRRREKKELDAVHLAQIRQAPDAPEVSRS